jgi:hypothetical protein
MKKPNFNPMFYSLFIYDVSFGGGKASPSVTFTSKDKKEKEPGVVDTGQEKIDSISVSSAKKDCKSSRDSLLGKLEDTLGKKDNVTMTKMRTEISSYFSTAAIRMSTRMTREQFSRHLANIAEKTKEYQVRIEQLAELLSHKELAKKEIKKVTEEMVTKYQALLLQERYAKKIESRHVLYVASAYLMRWEAANLKAIDRVYDIKTATKIYDDIRQRKGGAFKDLQTIEEDIMRVYDQWADSKGDDDDRKVYSDRNWDRKYEDKLPSYSFLAALGNSAYRGFSMVNPIAGAYRLVTGSSKPFKEGIDIYSTKGYLKWAREQANKGKFAPLPDLERADGGRHRAVITAGINPEKVKRNIEYGNRAVEFRNKLANAGKKDKISFGNPVLSEDTDEGKIAIQHNNKQIAEIQLASGGRYLLVVKDKKVDVTTMNPADVIKQVQELALKPKVENITVSKSSGRAQIKIEGNNLPAQSDSIDLRLGGMNLSKMGSGRTDIRLAPSFKSIDDNIKSVLKSALTEYADAQRNIGSQIKSKITDKLLEEIKSKVFPKSKKPRIVITGKASLEGSFKENESLAKRRADAAFKRLQEKNPTLTKANYDIQVVHFVTGPDGKAVANETEGWEKMKVEWNKAKDKLGEVKSIAELKKKINKPADGAQAAFVKKHFTDQRGADLLILPPASDDVKLDINMGNAPATTTPSAASPGAII